MNKFSSYADQIRKDSGKESTQNDSNPNVPQSKQKRQNSMQPTQSTQGNQAKGGQLDNSYSIYTTNGGQIQVNQLTSRASNLNNTNNMEQSNSYFAKMFPNKAQKVVDNVMEKYEKIKDIIEKNIKPNKYSLSDEEIQKLTISLSDFDQYKNKIETEYNEYQVQKQLIGTFEDNLQDMHLNKNLANCYSIIPKSFFKEYGNDEDTPFFNEIGRNVRALREYQNELVEYLDEVELNLFYQVYFRFNQILEMILDFDKMGKKCGENLMKIKIIKNMNQNMKKILLAGGNQIVKKKKAQERVQQIYDLLIKLKQFNANKELALQDDSRVQQILLTDEVISQKTSSLSQVSPQKSQDKPNAQNQEQRMKQLQVSRKLNEIIIYNAIQKKSVQGFKKEEQDYYTDFLDVTSKYLKENLNFKDQQKKVSHVENSVDISSIHSYNSNLHNDSASINYDQEEEIDESLQVFEWVYNEIAVNPTVESQIAQLYIKSSHNFEMIRYEVFKNNILKDVEKFQVNFRNKFRDYCVYLYKINNQQEQFIQDANDKYAFLNDVNDILLMKFSQFYSKIIKSYVTKFFSLTRGMKKEIIKSTFQTEQTEDYWESKVIPIVTNITQFQIELLELLTSDLVEYLQYLNTSTDANLPFKISTSNQIFSFWLNQFPEMFKKMTELDFSGAQSLSPQIQTQFNTANDEIIKTYDINYLYNQKSELQFELFNTFDEKQMVILKNALSSDNWIPCNISYKIYSLLDYFFISKKKADFTNNSDDEDDSRIRSNIIKGDSDEEEDLQDLNHYYVKKFERDYKIQLNKLIFEKENKRFMFTEGFLTFLRSMQKYIGIMSESKISYSQEYLDRFLTIIRFFNQFSRDFIVMAKGKSQPQMNNKVTVKNLAISSQNLTFLLRIFDKIEERLVLHARVNKEIADQELTKIKNEIQNHVSEIFGTIPNIIKDILQKSATQINILGWHRPQEKINVPLAQTARILDSIRSMYNVLEDILNISDMKYIFEIILNDFIETYVYTYSQLLNAPDSNRLSVQRIKDEVTYFTTEILDIPIIQLLNLDVLAQSIEQIIPLSKVPRLEEIKNKQNNEEEEQLSPNIKKEMAEQEDNNDILRIAKKFQSQTDNDDEQQGVKNKQLQHSENSKKSNNSNMSNYEDSTINSNNQEQQDNSQEESQIDNKK